MRLFAGFASQDSQASWMQMQGGALPPRLEQSRAALWQPLLEGLSPEERTALRHELVRKHL